MCAVETYQSIDEIIDAQNVRKEYIENVLSLVQDQRHIQVEIRDALELLEQINSNIRNVKAEIEISKELTPRLLEYHKTTVRLQEIINHIENNLPSKYNKLLQIQDNFDNNKNVSICSVGTTPNLPIKRHLDFENLNKSSQKSAPLHVDLPYLTQSEFSSIPGYMKGRVTYEVLNAFIDKINKCLLDKYTLLHMPKSAVKRRGDLDKIILYKRQECSKTKGRKFITQDDLKSEMGGKIDRNTLNLFPMLRHTGRLQEIRDGQLVKYIALTENN